jgi:hypothetical protein
MSRSRAERTRQVRSRALAIPAAAVKIPECRIPEVITEEPGWRVERLEQSELRYSLLGLAVVFCVRAVIAFRRRLAGTSERAEANPTD